MMTDDALMALAKAAHDDSYPLWTHEPIEPGEEWSERGWHAVWARASDGATTGLPGSIKAPEHIAAYIAACSPDVFLALMERVQRAEKVSAALHTITEKLAMPGMRVRVEFSGAGQVEMQWESREEDGWETLAEICNADSLADAVEKTLVELATPEASC